MNIDVACLICHGPAETMLHCFRECPFARKFWKNSSSIGDIDGEDGLIFLRDALVLGKLKEAVSMLFCLWKLWFNRNAVIKGGKVFEPAELVSSVVSLIDEWESIWVKERRVVRRARGAWFPPDRNWYKVNFDGALFTDQNRAGVGVVVRNDLGQVMAACSLKIQSLADPAHVEAMAALKVAQFASEMGFRDFSLEGDSLTIINAINGGMTDLSPIGHLIEGTKSILALSNCKRVSHVYRECNGAAHGLARQAWSVVDQLVWLEETPPCIAVVISSDYPINS